MDKEQIREIIAKHIDNACVEIKGDGSIFWDLDYRQEEDTTEALETLANVIYEIYQSNQ